LFFNLFMILVCKKQFKNINNSKIKNQISAKMEPSRLVKHIKAYITFLIEVIKVGDLDYIPTILTRICAWKSNQIVGPFQLSRLFTMFHDSMK